MNRGTMMLLLLAGVLQGCGTTPKDRTVSGAGVGAAAGAVVGAVTGLTVLQAAALGATAGALTGALTGPEDVNLGTPAWKQGSTAQPAPVSEPVPVTEIQQRLAQLGYDAGPADGIAGPRTESAIRAYQRDNGLLVDGRASRELAELLRAGGS